MPIAMLNQTQKLSVPYFSYNQDWNQLHKIYIAKEITKQQLLKRRFG